MFFISLYDKDYFLSNEYTPYPSGSKPPIKAQVAQPINPYPRLIEALKSRKKGVLITMSLAVTPDNGLPQ